MLCGSKVKENSKEVEADLISEISSEGEGQVGCYNLGLGQQNIYVLENQLERLRVTSPMTSENGLRPLGATKPCMGCMRVTARKVGLLKGRGKQIALFHCKVSW